MGGTASKPSVSNSKDNDEHNNKPPPKEASKPAPFIIENVSLPPDKSPKRRRRFSKKPATTRDPPPPRDDDDDDDAKTTTKAPQVTGTDVGRRHDAHSCKSPREPGKIETLVREGVTNISKTFKDWTMISSRGSKSAAPVIVTDRKRSSSPTVSQQRLPNQFNFHHASYLAQSKAEKQSSVDFSAPRHLNSATKQQPCGADYAPTSKHRDGVRKPVYTTSQHSKPDNIPAPRNKYGRKKDRSPYNEKKSRQNSPSYLYSLELKQGSSEHCPQASPMYITRAGRAQSPEYMAATYCTSNVVIVKPSRDRTDAVDKNSGCEWANPVGGGTTASSRCLVDSYSQAVVQEMVPIYLPSIQQDVVVQRVEVQPDLDYAVIKPKTIRVNGIEYVRKKSNHPLLKQLLTIDKEDTKVSTTLREKPERDQNSKSRKTGKEEKEDVNIKDENRSKNYEEKEQRISLDKAQRKVVDKNTEKRESIKSKTNGRPTEVETKEGSKPVREEKMSDGSETNSNDKFETMKPDQTKNGVEMKELQENERKNSKRDETSTKVNEKKDKSKRDSNSEDVREKKDTNKHGEKPNSRGSTEGTRKNANKRERNGKGEENKESTRRELDLREIEMKNLTQADKDIITQCRIRHMPVAVSSTGRLFLPSTTFSATPMATKCDPPPRVSACASEKSYCRIARTERLSPNRLRLMSPRRNDQLAKQRRTKKPSAEQERTSAAKEGKEGSENTNTGKNLVTIRVSPNRSPNRSPRSTSPCKIHKTGDGQTSPRANNSKEKPVLLAGREPKMAKEQKMTVQQEDEKTNRNVEIRRNSYPNQTKKRVTEGEKKNNKHEQRKFVDEKCASRDSSSLLFKEVANPKSHKSIDALCSRSVRSKNKMFETIIERSSSILQTSPRSGEQRRPSRRSSPQSQTSDTPFSKAIKLKYRDISAKRISKSDVCGKPETRDKSVSGPEVSDKSQPVVIPKVFTPWDSCMMFKSKHSQAETPRRRKSRSPSQQPRSPASRRETPTSETDRVWSKAPETHGGNVRPTPCPKSAPVWEETPPDNGARLRPPAPPKFPRDSCQPMRNHHRDLRTRQAVADCSCDLGSCHCVEVKRRSRCSQPSNDDLCPVTSSRYSKLNRDKVRDFEKKFRNTHVYRSVTGVVCKQPAGGGSAAGKEDAARATHAASQGNKGGHADPGGGARRQKRCPSCGKQAGDGGGGGRSGALRCAECGGLLNNSGSDSGGEEASRGGRCGEQHDMRGCTLQCCAHCGGECCGASRGKEQGGSGKGSSSSGLSTTSGQVPPYRKVLKMFETKSKLHAASASVPRFAPPPPPPSSSAKPKSGGVREVCRPASHFDRHKAPGVRVFAGDEDADQRQLHPRDVIIERRRPTHHGRYDIDDDDHERQQANDPHFNHSELELFKNARLQWMARDQQKRHRYHQTRGGNNNHLLAQQVRSHLMPVSTSKGMLRRTPNTAQDS